METTHGKNVIECKCTKNVIFTYRKKYIYFKYILFQNVLTLKYWKNILNWFCSVTIIPVKNETE